MSSPEDDLKKEEKGHKKGSSGKIQKWIEKKRKIWIKSLFLFGYSIVCIVVIEKMYIGWD